VRLQQADDDLATRLLFGHALEQHLVRLADSGGHADEDLQAPRARIRGR